MKKYIVLTCLALSVLLCSCQLIARKAIIGFALLTMLTSRFIGWSHFDRWDKYSRYSPDSTEIVGVWTADDGAIIEINNDGTCILHNVNKKGINNYYYYFGTTDEKSSFYNFSGYWRITPDVSHGDTICYQICLDARPTHLLTKEEKMQWDKGGCVVYMNIHNEKVDGAIKPSMIWGFIGDPDNFDMYRFYKKTE